MCVNYLVGFSLTVCSCRIPFITPAFLAIQYLTQPTISELLHTDPFYSKCIVSLQQWAMLTFFMFSFIFKIQKGKRRKEKNYEKKTCALTKVCMICALTKVCCITTFFYLHGDFCIYCSPFYSQKEMLWRCQKII